MIKKYIFVPDFEIEADSEIKAFDTFIDALETDIKHFRANKHTQIEYKILDELMISEMKEKVKVYNWHWVDGEDQDEGNSWIQISDLEGEEIAIIMCRNFEQVKVEHPEWISQKEDDAKQIVHLFNETIKQNG